MKRIILALMLLLLSTTSVYALSMQQSGGKYLTVNGDDIDTTNVTETTYSNVSGMTKLHLKTGEVMSYPTTYDEFGALRQTVVDTRRNYYHALNAQQNLQIMSSPQYAAQQANKARQKAVMDCLQNAMRNGTSSDVCRQISGQGTNTNIPILNENQQIQQAQQPLQYYPQQVQQQDNSYQQVEQTQNKIQSGMNILNTGLGIVRSIRTGY